MVRGKCVFLNISDILETVGLIVQFVKRNSATYKILEIESRFNLPIPISDVTLKVAINNEIVA